MSDSLKAPTSLALRGTPLSSNSLLSSHALFFISLWFKLDENLDVWSCSWAPETLENVELFPSEEFLYVWGHFQLREDPSQCVTPACCRGLYSFQKAGCHGILVIILNLDPEYPWRSRKNLGYAPPGWHRGNEGNIALDFFFNLFTFFPLRERENGWMVWLTLWTSRAVEGNEWAPGD